MIDIKVKVEGLNEWKKYLKDLNPKIVRGMAEAIKKSALLIEGQAKLNAPVDNGILRGSILTEIRTNYAEVMPTVNYAVYVHEGTSPHVIDSPVFMPRIGWRYIGIHPGTKARPFMSDAVRQTQDEINDIFSSELEKAIR